MKKIIFSLFIFFTCSYVFAATVDTVIIYSTAMNKAIKCVIVKPDSYKKKNKYFPVVYLLHGYDDYYDSWIKLVPDTKNYADQMNMIFVCPDGGYNSWYFDSPIDSSYKYETYISKEVVKYIDANYRTIANPSHRAITGVSMGGHGSLYLALRNPDIFGAVGSMSGVVDLVPFAADWEISKLIGDTISYKSNWQNMSFSDMIEHYPTQSLSIIIDCGTNDLFFKINRRLHEKMLRLKIPHDYIERPGKHNWAYWNDAMEYQLIFFRNYFKNGKRSI